MKIAKKNQLTLAIFLLLCLRSMAQLPAAGNASVPYDPNRQLTVNQLQFDLAIMKDALIKTHPGLFWHQSEQEFLEKYAQIQRKISSPMTELEFYALLTPFIGSIKCDHTNMEMSAPFYDLKQNTTPVFPFLLKAIGPHLYIYRNCSGDASIPLGARIVSVNGLSADSILAFVKPRSWADGYVESLAYLGTESSFTPLFQYLFQQADTYTLNVQKPDGAMAEFVVKAPAYGVFRQYHDKQSAVWLSPEYEHFSFSTIDSLSTGVMKINAFEGDGYYTFLNASFSALKEKGIRNLIIDLRGNGGGEGEYIGPLYRKLSNKDYREIREVEMKVSDPEDSIYKYGQLPEGKENFVKFYKKYIYKTADGRYLMRYGPMDDFQEKPFKPRKNHYTGRVYLLTDVQTSSAGSQLSVLAHFNKRATLVGRETGGGYLGNTAGWDFPLTLPNSKLIVHIPMIRTFNAVTGPEHRGVSPDYPIPETIEDLVLERDSVLLFTLHLISTSEQSKK